MTCGVTRFQANVNRRCLKRLARDLGIEVTAAPGSKLGERLARSRSWAMRAFNDFMPSS